MVNLWKTKVMASGDITKNGLSKNKVHPCEICGFMVMDNSPLCVKCGNQIHSRCAGETRLTTSFSRTFAHKKCEGNNG